jgi:hypothetical protein
MIVPIWKAQSGDLLQDPSNLLTGSAGGYVSGQIYYDAFLARFGHGGGGIVAMGAVFTQSHSRGLLPKKTVGLHVV